MIGKRILLSPSDWQAMQQHVERCLPREACGFLAGQAARVEWVIPVANIASSPARFEMDPGEQVAALHAVEGRGLDLLGIYHSHPSGPAEPSETDRLESTYPGCAHVIWGREGGSWVCRAFILVGRRFEQVPLQLVDEGGDERRELAQGVP